MPYINLTEGQKLRVASVDLEKFLHFRSEGLIRSERDKRLKSDHSMTVNGNERHNHAAQKGGRPILFIQTFYDIVYALGKLYRTRGADFFYSNDQIIVYYDTCRVELTKIITTLSPQGGHWKRWSLFPLGGKINATQQPF